MRRTLTSLGGAVVVPAALFALGLFLLALPGCGPSRELKAHTVDVEPITPDVDLIDVRCGADEQGARAEGELTNKSGRRATFEIAVEFYDRAGRYYTGAAVTTPPITPGDVATWEVHPATPAAAGGVCEVVQVREVPEVEQHDDAAPVDGS